MFKKIILCLILISFAACTHIYTRKGMYYKVGKGETLQTVASKYKVSVQELAEVNNIENSSQIREGRSIYIPGMTPRGLANIIERSREKSKKSAKKKPTIEKGKKKKTPQKPSKKNSPKTPNAPEESSEDSDNSIHVERDRFSWPIQGEISSPFGMRHGRRHDGIDIRSPIGTPVAAAGPGEVVFCKRMRGYGNLVLIRHKDDFFTVYAHNSVNLAKVGQKVKKGQIIAKVGRTGRATGPHLHFEVRQGTKPRNPLFFLPKNEYAKQLNFEEQPGSASLSEDHEEHSEDEGVDENAETAEEVKPTEAEKTLKKEVKPKKEVVKKEVVKKSKKVNRARPEKKKKKETQSGRSKK